MALFINYGGIVFWKTLWEKGTLPLNVCNGAHNDDYAIHKPLVFSTFSQLLILCIILFIIQLHFALIILTLYVYTCSASSNAPCKTSRLLTKFLSKVASNADMPGERVSLHLQNRQGLTDS